MRRIPTLASPIKGHVSIARSDYRKLVRVARAAQVVALHRKHSKRDLQLAAFLAWKTVDALNAKPKRKR